MTVYGFNFIQLASDAYNALPNLNSEGTPPSKPKTVEPDKILESITTCGYLALLATLEKNTKIGVSGNKIIYYPPGLVQSVSRRLGAAGQADFKKYRILHIAMSMPLAWFDTDKEISDLIRIQSAAIKGIKMLQETYRGTYVVDHLNKYILEFEKSKIEMCAPKDGLKEKVPALKNSSENPLGKQLWNENQLEYLAGLLEEAQAQKEEGNSQYDISRLSAQQFLDSKVSSFQRKLVADTERRHLGSRPIE